MWDRVSAIVMATDKSLATLLRALQSASDAQEVTRSVNSSYHNPFAITELSPGYLDQRQHC